MGESKRGQLSGSFDPRVGLEFVGGKITSNAGLLAYRELDEKLGLTTAAMAYTHTEPLILDLDSSQSPVHGQQEGARYTGHYGSVCYHPQARCFGGGNMFVHRSQVEVHDAQGLHSY